MGMGCKNSLDNQNDVCQKRLDEYIGQIFTVTSYSALWSPSPDKVHETCSDDTKPPHTNLQVVHSDI